MLLIHAKILTMTDTDYEDGYIWVHEGKIVDVGDMHSLEAKRSQHSSLNEYFSIASGKDIDQHCVIDLGGKYVLPGWVDAHCHIGLWEDSVGFEGEDGNEMTDPITPHLRAIDGVYHADRAFQEAREHGVTTVVTGPGSANVVGGQFVALKTWGRSVDEMVIRDPVAMKVAFGENPKTVYHEKRQMPMTRMATAALLRETLMKAKEYQGLMDAYLRDEVDHDKPDYDAKLEAFLPVLRKEIPLKAHAHRSDDILTAIRIAKEFDILLSIEHCTEGYLIKEQLKALDIPVVVGPMLTDRSKIELRNQSLKNPGILADEGIKVAIMTDHPCVPIQHLSLCAAIAVREGMSEDAALRAITLHAAQACGIADRVGCIAVGKDADVVVYDGHPLELRTHVVMTIIDGRIVFERR